MKITPCEDHGQPRWRIEYTDPDRKRKRRFFASQEDAKKAVEAIEKDRAELGNAWNVLPLWRKAEWMQIMKEMSDRGIESPREFWEKHKNEPNQAVKNCPTLAAAIDETIDTKRKAKRREKYVHGLDKYLRMFARGREATPVNKITLADIEGWFDARNEAPSTRRSNLGRLSALFDLCWRRRYITENPCERVEAISIDRKTPSVLSNLQAWRAILWARNHKPRFLAWLTLALFVGLRPESEADNIEWSVVDWERKRIRIEGSKSKIRAHRIIDLSLCPPAVEWLKVAHGIGSPLNMPHGTRRRYLRDLRKFLGFERWPQDVLRHTAASSLLAFHQDAGKVANFLGNSAGTLLRDYKALTYKEDAAKFMALLPKARHFTKRVSE